MTDTIAAIATARGQAGVAIIRVSGPQSWPIASQLFSRTGAPDESGRFSPGHFYHGWILEVDPPRNPVDEVLLLVFQAPHSFTGEDIIEIHCHGGDYLSHKILALCFKLGAVPAQPGEFTKRAFLSGRIDLTQAESLLDLISAKSDKALTLASANLKNRSLAHHIDILGETIIHIQALIVASVDFPDEVDEPDRGMLTAQLKPLLEKAEALEAASRRGRMLQEGLTISLLGRPNSGKSSLFNALLATERAIVTDTAGTTRDIITERLMINGVPITLTDTAGIREQSPDQPDLAINPIEIIGIERSWQAADASHTVLYIVDASVGLTTEDKTVLARLSNQPVQIMANKSDLLTPSEQAHWQKTGALLVSAKTGSGLEALFQWLELLIKTTFSQQDTAAIALNQRQVDCLSTMRDNLLQAQAALQNPALPLDLVTVMLTAALRSLDEMMGRETSEEVLDSVFQQFCVGK